MKAKLIFILIILIGAGPCRGLKNPISPNSKSNNASSVSFDTDDVATKAELVARKLEPTKYCGLGNRDIEGLGFAMQWDPYQEFPWMVAILRENTTNKNIYQCGGSLIAPSVVLTGAHCVQARQAKNFKVRAGYFESNDTSAFQDRQVVEMIVHENFNKGSLYNDVALLFLDAPFKEATGINTICLPPPEAYFDMSHCFVKTWTKQNHLPNGQNENIMKTIRLPVVPDAECEAELRKTRLGKLFVLHSSFMCAGKRSGEDTCKGDGGSPLICPIGNNTSTFFQVGIVSWGIGCGEENVPGLYASVPRLRSWIDEKLASKGVNPAYYTSD